MVYNLTNITEANNILEQSAALNNLSGNIWFPLIMAAFFFIALSTFTSVPFKYRFFGVSFISVMSGVLLLVQGLITLTVLLIPIILFFASIILLLFVN